MNHSSRPLSDADPSAITIDEARARIEKSIRVELNTESVDLNSALGRITSADITSPMSVPSFRASAMDGYAVRVAESHEPLMLTGQSFAGHPGDNALAPFCCQRITTGARVPDDADAVVQQENVERVGDQIRIKQQPFVGLHVRDPGSDSTIGSHLISANSRLGPAEMGLLAAHGVTRIEVKRKMCIAMFSTGDELSQPGQSLKDGQIYDANRPLISTLLANSAIEIIDLGISKDTKRAIDDAFCRASEADFIVSSGGVSVGDADHVRAVLESHGRMELWKIAMKPGRPLTFGMYGAGQPYFGLPGNPVSAAITCLLFVKPAIDYALGIAKPLFPALKLPVCGVLTKNPGRVEYQRAIMQQSADGNWHVQTTGIQDSHVLSSLHKANCLIELPLESEGAVDGDIVNVYPFTHFGNAQL